MLAVVKTISVAAPSLRVQFQPRQVAGQFPLSEFIRRNRYCRRRHPGAFCLGLAFLMFFSFFDDLAKFRNGRYVWGMQPVLGYTAPCRNPLQRSVYAAFIDNKHVFRGPYFRFRVRFRVLWSALRGIWGGALAAHQFEWRCRSAAQSQDDRW